MKIPFSKVVCDGNELQYVQRVLESGWLTTAGVAQELEKRFAEAVDAPHAVAVNSCTAALHLSAEAQGIGHGDQVFVPTMTFTATAEVIRYLGADPVFLDVDYGTSLLTPAILEEAIVRHPEVKYLIVVHYGGQAAEMVEGTTRGILQICAEQGITVIEVAAHAFPARDRGWIVGNLGHGTCFSFYANKTITTAEGGMLTTADEAVARRARVMRLHGIDRDIWNRYTTPNGGWEYDVIAPGFKDNMADVNAAIGLAQLERAEAMRKERQRCAEFYLEALKEIDCIDLPALRVEPEDHAWHLFPIVLKAEAPLSRNAFIDKLSEKGISASVHYKPLHRMSYYRERYHLDPKDFPNAERRWQGLVSLPIYPSLLDQELEYICGEVKEMLNAEC